MASLYQGLSPTAFDFWAQPVFKRTDGALYCPGFTGETYSKSAWDYVVIQGDTQTPGICEVSCDKSRDVDKKKAAGSNGARLTIHGIEPAIVEIEITIWTPEQLKQLRSLVEAIFPANNKRPKGVSATDPWPPAFDVNHPTFQTHKVKSLVFTKITGPAPGKVTRSKMFKISALEFLPPSKKKATATPVKSKGSTLDPDQTTYPTPGSSSKNTGPVAAP